MATLKEVFTNIASAIREKIGSTTTITPSEMPALISSIETGVDTSDATATAADILNDKTAYANGEKLIGTLEKGVSLQQYTYKETPIIDNGHIKFYCYGIKSTSTLINFAAIIKYTFNGTEYGAIIGGLDDGGYMLMASEAGHESFPYLRTTFGVSDNYITVNNAARYIIPSSGSVSSITITGADTFRADWYNK